MKNNKNTKNEPEVEEEEENSKMASVMVESPIPFQNPMFLGNFAQLIKESDDRDKVLYKYVNPSESALEQLKNDISNKLKNNQGEIIIPVGLSSKSQFTGLSPIDFEASVATIRSLAKSLKAQASLTYQKPVKTTKRIIGEVLVRHDHETYSSNFVDIRIAIVGNVDSGKSTLIGVLTQGKLDNGRGAARKSVFNFKHEIDSGRTSSVSLQILGYSSKGEIVNYKSKHGRMSWNEICSKSSKVVTFIDLAGHEKYLKTTVYGMTGGVADYACLVVGSNMGVTRMTKEHLGITLALKIPFFIALTKIDLCPENVLKNTIKTLTKILKMSGVRKIPFFVKEEKDIFTSVKNICSERICPIFVISNVTGEKLDYLRKFINLLPRRYNYTDKVDKPSEFFVDGIYYVTGVGTVVSGMVNQGEIRVNDFLMLGPDGNGAFRRTQVKSIHRLRVNVDRVQAGQMCTLALRKEKRSQIRKGMVLLKSKKPKAFWEFTCSVQILFHSTTIKVNYQPVIHTNHVRQSAKIVEMSVPSIRTGDKAKVRFRFMQRPEYLVVGAKLIFREGRTKGIGKVLEVFE